MPYADPDRHRESVQKSHARNPAIKQRWVERNREKHNAKGAVWRAIQRGELVPEPCLFCDAEPAEAHHHDYTKRLDVTWLCDRHHKLAHRASWHQTRSATRASKPAEERACPTCGALFVVPYDSLKRYCHVNCRNRATYHRNRQEAV